MAKTVTEVEWLDEPMAENRRVEELEDGTIY
jgi:hypothetical protein